MRKKCKPIFIVLALISLLVILLAVFFVQINKRLESLLAWPMEDVNLVHVSDGIYQGRYHAFPIEAVVEVTMKDGKMIAIDLIKHTNGQGEAAEAILGRVVESQSLKVDAIAGATYSSKVIVLAIKDALALPAE